MTDTQNPEHASDENYALDAGTDNQGPSKETRELATLLVTLQHAQNVKQDSPVWFLKTNHDRADYRMVYTELQECSDHLPFGEWWKGSETCNDTLKRDALLEIADSLHFAISHYIRMVVLSMMGQHPELNGADDEKWLEVFESTILPNVIENLARIIHGEYKEEKATDLAVVNNMQAFNFELDAAIAMWSGCQLNTKEFLESNKTLTSPFAIDMMEHTTVAMVAVLRLPHYMGFKIDDLLNMFKGKMALNQFRVENGYIKGKDMCYLKQNQDALASYLFTGYYEEAREYLALAEGANSVAGDNNIACLRAHIAIGEALDASTPNGRPVHNLLAPFGAEDNDYLLWLLDTRYKGTDVSIDAIKHDLYIGYKFLLIAYVLKSNLAIVKAQLGKDDENDVDAVLRQNFAYHIGDKYAALRENDFELTQMRCGQYLEVYYKLPEESRTEYVNVEDLMEHLSIEVNYVAPLKGSTKYEGINTSF